jgi:adenosylcobalamin-dependent ribonucleoside-triphosphate reductase
MVTPSVRASLVESRTYLRPIDEDAGIYETPEQAADRVIGHQAWLWARAKAGMQRDTAGGWVLGTLTDSELAELAELRALLLNRCATVSGRTRWLGGTEIGRQLESTQFNCSFTEMASIHDVVDMLWLLLQGCGVGFRPIVGSLNGFARPMKVTVIRSTRTKDEKGPEHNVETFDRETGVWHIRVGDSAVAWAKSIGKILAGKYPAKELILDFGYIRGPGGRLRNYGWISSGDEQISRAYAAIAEIMNDRAGQLLTRIDLLDIADHLGTILSSRRSALIALMAFGEPEWEDFARAKKDHTKNGMWHRGASNNSIMFYSKPTRYQLTRIFKIMQECGGSEPGFINAAEALRRAPWFKGANPCAEILLANRGFCNLVETVLSRFNGDEEALHRAHWLIARANYRQTCVHLEDPVLQRGWHENQEFLRLCGAGVTGVVGWEHVDEDWAWESLRNVAHDGANTMADELDMPRSKAITTIKPSGTQSKALGTIEYGEVAEGIHKPLGKFIFNNVRFSTHDPLVAKLRAANYHLFADPSDPTGVIARLPVEFKHVAFDDVDGVPLNLESAVSQLDRYRRVMRHYVDHNASITVSYDPSEVPDIVNWLMENWDDYVGVSFIYRNDHTKTAADLGYAYLPQEVVTEAVYREYVSGLKPLDSTGTASSEMLSESDCASGACPIR